MKYMNLFHTQNVWLTLHAVLTCFIVSSAAEYSSTKAMNFLTTYGYLPRSDLETGFLRSADEVKKAVMQMQRMAHIPVTGVVDAATAAKMQAPRCGVSDFDVRVSNRVRRYLKARSKWHKLELTWRLEKGTPDLPTHIVKRTLKQAMTIWSDASRLTFVEMPHQSDVDMKIRFGYSYHGDSYPFDREGGVLAHAFFPGSGWGGDLHFDESEKWTVESYEGQNLLYVAVHELGHALGLRHSDVRNSIMYPYARGYDPKLKLYPDDTAGIQDLYGRPSKIPTTPAVATTTTTTRPPYTVAPTEPPVAPGFCPQKIDAISVIRGETFIFSGMKYWRYNYLGKVGSRPHLVRDFWQLPQEVTKIDAVYMRPYSGQYMIVFFSGKHIYEFDGIRLRSVKTLQDIGIPSDIDHIDAAFVWGLNDMTYLVSGRMYWRYDDKIGGVQRDYPRDMSMWQGVPVPVDSAFSSKDRNGEQRTYFFKDRVYYEVDNRVMRVTRNQMPPTVQFWSECFASLREAARISAAPTKSATLLTMLLTSAFTVLLIRF